MKREKRKAGIDVEFNEHGIKFWDSGRTDDDGTCSKGGLSGLGHGKKSLCHNTFKGSKIPMDEEILVI